MSYNPMNLDGRRILVTGASSGIGQETAILLSQLGARTVLAGRNRERLVATLSRLEGEGHQVETFDLHSAGAIPRWMKSLTQQGGPLHGLVHSAGVQNLSSLAVLKVEQFEEVIRTNLTAAVMLARGFRQRGCNSGGGSVVFLSSVAGLTGQPGLAAYTASKAALVGVVKSLAMELVRDRIRVNCVAPGCVKTPMLDRLESSMTPEQFTSVESMHPLGFGTPRDVANGIAFLLADTARWITGTTVVIDGGFTAH